MQTLRCPLRALCRRGIRVLVFQAVEFVNARSGDDDASLDAYLALARFADAQYQNIVTYCASSTYEAKQALVKQAKRDMEELSTVGDKPSNRSVQGEREGGRERERE